MDGLNGASVEKPILFPLRPCCKDPTSKTLGCLATGYFPEPVTVTWDEVNQNMSVRNFPATLSSGLYVTTSQMTVLDNLTTKRFTCRVVHEPSATYENKTIQACLSSNITVELLHSSCDPRGFHSIRLYCFISGYTPGDLKVTWLKNNHPIIGANHTAPPTQKGKLASTSSELNVTQEEWLSENIFTCQVTYKGEILQAHAQKCTEYEPRGVNAYLLPPSPLDLYVHKKPTLTCLVVDLESEEGVRVTWSLESGKAAPAGFWSSMRHYNATTSVVATLPVSTQDWLSGEAYQCTVTQDHLLPKGIMRSITKTPGQRQVPEVYLFPPPEEESSDKFTLSCMIQNFFPKDISVQWLQNEQPLPDSKHGITPPLQTSDSSPTFFIFSRLEVTRADWMQSNKFTCRVVHEAVDKPWILEKMLSKNPEPDLQELCTEEAEELEELWASTCVFVVLFLLSVSYGACITLFKVKWVYSALPRDTPQPTHDYANVLQPQA